MATPLITLTTDFGLASPYVAAMKGAVLTVNPTVQLVDLSHSLPPQNLVACSFFLRWSVPFFPAGTLHVIVVDPGVGTDRALLYVETGGQRLLVPDNGCWTELARSSNEPPKVVTLTERRYWRQEISSTFHGRDILAPVAGHLSLGVSPDQLGRAAGFWADCIMPEPRIAKERLECEVLFIDDFGNLITNLPGEYYRKSRDLIAEVLVGAVPIVIRQVQTYGEAAVGELVFLVGSAGLVEIAEVQGNAARRLGAASGTRIFLMLRLSDTL